MRWTSSRPRRLVARLAPWPPDAPAGRWARIGFATIAAVLLVGALIVKPLPAGDALEYLLQTESLARHASPEVRAKDVLSLARQDARLSLGLNFALGYRGYFDDPSGKWYAVHFWAYSLLATPARLVLPVLGLSGLHAFPLTSAIFFVLALHHLLFVVPFAPRWRVLLACLWLTSPALLFLRWPHAEAITVAATTLALSMRYAQRPIAALPWAALASLQSPPLVILVALLWVDALRRRPGLRAAATATLGASLCLLSPLFYLWRFGTPSLVARESASPANLSLGRAAQLFVDPDIGLVRAMPIAVLLLAVAVLIAFVRIRTLPFEAGLAGAIALMALSSTATDNWNHGTIGPSRYAVWLVACVLFLVVRMAETAPPRVRVVLFVAGLAAAGTQAVFVAAKGGPLARPDDLEHSLAARLVLRYAPALYQPDAAVFAARTLGQPPSPVGLVVYQENGRCRKALARPGDEAELRARCGAVPESSRSFFASSGVGPRYVDY